MRAFCRRAQRRDLARREAPIAAARQIAEADGPERDAPQPAHAMTERGAVALDLVLAAFRERELHHCRVAVGRQDHHLERPRRTVVEHDAAPPAIERARHHTALDLGLVHARQAVARMQETMRERAVVGHQQRALDVPVETADGIESRLDVADEIGHDGTAARVAHGRDVAGRLVQNEVVLGLGPRQWPAVDGDDVALGVGQRAELAGDGAVDGDTPVGDEPVSSPPAAQPRLRQDLVEPELRHPP